MRPVLTFFLVFGLSVWSFAQSDSASSDTNSASHGYNEVRLQRCDRLFVVPVTIEGRERTFLLDTGASSILNLASFVDLPDQDLRSVPGIPQPSLDVTSVSGRKNVEGRTIAVKTFAFAGGQLHDLHLSAIDLSALNSACGRTIEGVLGADLLEKLGVLIDLGTRAARLRPQPLELFEDAKRQFLECAEFFNRGDSRHLREHMDPSVQWFSPFEEVRGRDAVIQFLTDSYFAKHARLTVLRMDAQDFHVAGDSYWMNYEYQIEADDRSYRARGTLFSYRNRGQWLITTVHNSVVGSPPPASSGPAEAGMH